MPAQRKVVITSIDLTPLETKAYNKIIRHYYKGPHDVTIRFDNRLACWGEHCFEKNSQEHVIRISPHWCTYNMKEHKRDFEALEMTGTLSKMNAHDIVCRIINTTLHELRHAKQCDDGVAAYEEETINETSPIRQTMLKYELSPLETDAESWAYSHFWQALERYKKWCEFEI